jgi:hypothetical protein
MSKIPVDNGSSLNKQVTLKIIALTNITLIETSVSVVYLLGLVPSGSPPVILNISLGRIDALFVTQIFYAIKLV